MTKIKKYVEDIAEELKDAQEYIEKGLWYKAKGDTNRYAKYKEMSAQELNHASMLHDMAAQDIEALKTVYPEVPEKMLEKCGYRREGLIRQGKMVNTWCDYYIYAILADEGL